MRPIEALLLLANLLTFVALVVPWLRALGLAGYLAGAAALVAAAQVLLEGYRWQMVPAYALTAALLLAWGLARPAPAGPPVPRAVAYAAAALGALALVLAV